MDFEKKYGTKFWLLMDELADRSDLPAELKECSSILENILTLDNSCNEPIHTQGTAVVSMEKEQAFFKLAADACRMAEQNAIDIKVKGASSKRGVIELKSDLIIFFTPASRKTMAKLLRLSDDARIDAIDGEVRITLWYNLCNMEFC